MKQNIVVEYLHNVFNLCHTDPPIDPNALKLKNPIHNISNQDPKYHLP